jgi:hypothetical protein
MYHGSLQGSSGSLRVIQISMNMLVEDASPFELGKK